MTGRGLAIIAAVVAIVGWLGLTQLEALVTKIESMASPVALTKPQERHPYSLPDSLANRGQPSLTKQPLELDPPPPEIRFHPEEVRRFDAIKALFHGGQYQKALDTIYAQLADDRSTKPYKAILVRKIPIVTTAIAIQLSNQGHCSRAVEIFLNAINRDPEQIDAHSGLLYCFIYLKQVDEGLRHIDAYKLQSRPGYQLTEPISLLFEQGGRKSEAMFLVKKLIRHLLSQKSPDFQKVQELRARLEVLQSRLSEHQLQVSERNANFRITYREGDHEDISRWLLENAEQILDEFNRDYQLPYPSKPIETVLYPKEEFTKLVGYGPSWAKGMFDGKIRLPIDRTDNGHLLGIFRHELAHALLWEAFAGKAIPSWFNEGFAQFVECPKGCTLNARRHAASQDFLPLEDFLGSFIELPAAKARTVYIQSQYMVALLSGESLGFGGSVYATIIQQVAELPRQGDTVDQASMSEALLKPVDLSFKQLHRMAARKWRQLAPSQEFRAREVPELNQDDGIDFR